MPLVEAQRQHRLGADVDVFRSVHNVPVVCLTRERLSKFVETGSVPVFVLQILHLFGCRVLSIDTERRLCILVLLCESNSISLSFARQVGCIHKIVPIASGVAHAHSGCRCRDVSLYRLSLILLLLFDEFRSILLGQCRLAGRCRS